MDKDIEEIIKNAYDKQLRDIPTFSDDMIKNIQKEIERVTKEVFETSLVKEATKDDNVNTTTPVYYKEMSDKIDKEIERLDKEYKNNK